ncbi:MAG: formylglycine-generating enzyme family protein, partial [Prochlorotrichaceae cyanobacterium]
MAPDLPTQSVQILQKTYHLPLLRSEQLQDIQSRLRDRQRIIKTGRREEAALFGLRTRVINLGPQERMGELNAQITDYKRLINLVTTHKVAYQQFLLQLAAEIRQVFAQKCQQIQRDENERARDEAYARQRQNPVQLQALRQEKRELLEELVLLDKAASLMLKKIDLICQGLDRISADKALQENIVTDLVNDIEVYKRMMSRRQRAEQRREDTRRFADLALNFEEYMRRYFGPFQELINQTAQIDSGMGRTVQEISTLAEEVVGATANLVNLEELLQLEVVSAEIQDHLGLALERAALERDWAGGGLGLISDSDLDQTSVDRAISQIQGYLDSELGKLQQRFPAGEIPLLPIAPSWASWEGVGFTLPGENLSFDLPKNGGKLEFIAVPGGTLTMEGGHKVNLQPFLMGKYPITQRQYQAVMGKNPSHFKGENRPVEKVNWHEARSFCQKLSELLGQQIDLPSETQWEWAARGATQSQGFEYAGSNNLDEVGWYIENSGRQTHPVGEKKPNELGLYDMSGNVWEWCKDNWTDNSNALPRDGSALTSNGNSDLRAVRGGSWDCNPVDCRCAQRDWNDPVIRVDYRGFRV